MSNMKIGAIVIGLVVMGLLLGFSGILRDRLTVESIEIKVLKTERETKVSADNTQSKYMVTAENEVFENTDTMSFWKFDSSDVQRQLQAQGTYKVMVCSWRWPFLSWYRNIIKVERVLKKPGSVNNDGLQGKIQAIVDVKEIDDKTFRDTVRKMLLE